LAIGVDLAKIADLNLRVNLATGVCLNLSVVLVIDVPSVQSALGADLFVTHAPCIECAKGIKTAGFKKVWYRNSYRSDEGIAFLEKLGVEVEKI